jgi:ABC-type xylose transport system substrate-binding protein
MKNLKTTLLASALALLSLPVMADSAHPKIGFSIDDLRLERWSRDRDYFVAAAEKMDAKVFVQSADANEQKQISQIENLISRGVDVIVIVPFNATVLTNAVAEAKKAGIKVVSYDRLILNADIDAYISFDNEKVGEMQAAGVLKAAPKGNYFLLGGAPTDNNAKVLREGQMKVLQPAIDKGDIKIVGQQWEHRRERPDQKQQQNRRHCRLQRRHRRRRDSGPGGAETGRQSADFGPGRRPGSGQARDRRYADHDRVQATETDRLRGRETVGATGPQ